jgi:hypothetical protein
VCQYFEDVQALAQDLARAALIDANLFKYKPSVLAAALLFLAMQLQFEHLISTKQIRVLTKEDQLTLYLLCSVFRHFRINVLEWAL